MWFCISFTVACHVLVAVELLHALCVVAVQVKEKLENPVVVKTKRRKRKNQAVDTINKDKLRELMKD